MEDLAQLIEKLELEKNIHLNNIPDIDLYMDQVIQLFEKTFNSSKRNEEDKILTKTMINNYAKGKLFFPVENKKYSREHIIIISLIYQLKGALSIGDIKSILTGINEKTVKKDFDLEQFYESYLNLYGKNIESFKVDLKERASDVQAEIAQSEGTDADYLEKVLLTASLVNISNFYRKAAENLVDTLK